MNKKPLTQSEFERIESKLANLRLKLKEKKMMKDEAIQFLVVSMHYGKGRATQIVTDWSQHFYNNTNPRRYNPNPVIKKMRNSEMVAVIKLSKDDNMIEVKSETDLGIEREML